MSPNHHHHHHTFITINIVVVKKYEKLLTVVLLMGERPTVQILETAPPLLSHAPPAHCRVAPVRARSSVALHLRPRFLPVLASLLDGEESTHVRRERTSVLAACASLPPQRVRAVDAGWEGRRVGGGRVVGRPGLRKERGKTCDPVVWRRPCTRVHRQGWRRPGGHIVSVGPSKSRPAVAKVLWRGWEALVRHHVPAGKGAIFFRETCATPPLSCLCCSPPK